MIAVVLGPHHAKRVELVEQVIGRAVVFVFAIALEYAEGLCVAEFAYLAEAHGEPAQDGVVQPDGAGVVAEHALNGTPVSLEQAGLLAVALRDEQVVAHEVGCDQGHAFRVEALEYRRCLLALV